MNSSQIGGQKKVLKNPLRISSASGMRSIRSSSNSSSVNPIRIPREKVSSFHHDMRAHKHPVFSDTTNLALEFAKINHDKGGAKPTSVCHLDLKVDVN